ncbi:MAG: efflux RND transporter permease subunit [Anaerotruncus sp.]|nr:efflux RND transporter permease subunit [Anaerotruncus sp.]
MENEVVEPLEEALDPDRGHPEPSPRARAHGRLQHHRRDRAVARRRPGPAGRPGQGVAGRRAACRATSIRRSSPSRNPEDQPIMMARLGGPYPQRVLSDYVRYGLKEKLQTIPGIGEISLMGTLERNVRIWLDAARLDEKGLTVRDVISRPAARAHRAAGRPAGDARAARSTSASSARRVDLETLRKIVVREVGGSPIYLSDVALVEDGFEDVRRIARVDGGPAQGIGIKKQRGANAVAVAKQVRRALDEYQQDAARGHDRRHHLRQHHSSSAESVNEIQFELLLSVLLTALVCWMFLGSLSEHAQRHPGHPHVAARHGGHHLLPRLHLQHLHPARPGPGRRHRRRRRHHGHGEHLPPPPRAARPWCRAALEGTKEIAFAALAATLAVVAIFIPVVFMKGIIGRYFLQFGITLCLAVLLSYVEAVTLAPARCSQFLKTSREGRSRVRPGRRPDLRQAGGPLRPDPEARPAPARAGPRPGRAVLFAAASLVFMVLPSEFVPSQDQSRVMIRLQTAVGSDITETDQPAPEGRGHRPRPSPRSSRRFSFVGGMGGGGGQLGHDLRHPGPARASGSSSQAEFSAVLRRELNAIPGIAGRHPGHCRSRASPPSAASRSSSRCAAPTGTSSSPLSQEIMADLAASGVVVDLDTDYQRRHARAADHARPGRMRRRRRLRRRRGHDHQRPGRRRPGRQVQHRRPAPRRPAQAAWPASARGPRTSSRLRVRARNGRPRPALVAGRLSRSRPALQAITRRDRERAISIFANVAPGHSQDEALQLRRADGPRPAGRLPGRPGRLERGLPRVHEQPALRHVPGHRHRLHDPGLAVQLLQGPGHDHHHPAAVDRRRGLRPAGHAPVA